MSIATMAADDLAILHNELATLLEHKFFIVAKTLEGARFFSEDFYSYEAANEAFKKYIGVVEYFSDYGVVSMYEYTIDAEELVKEEIILR